MEDLADKEVEIVLNHVGEGREADEVREGKLVFVKGASFNAESGRDDESTQNHDSFVNMGRPSDMNEDRIISKETQDAMAREHIRKEMLRINSKKSSNDDKNKSANNQKATDFSGFPYGESLGTIDMRTFDLTNRVTISGK